ncbi:MAG: hypothetical protein A2V72_01215 [Candidatus Nealsonbacteria bacterium RBG_13_37_56]|uniref:TrpR like protein, YerC/YecD n=1 Tax=Candidatus Nealsonbacteria bacterium RBG_13_37_56 TaxID=1801661 RepID=A0A1G2DXX9_9BACT|nr:Trp family transcriptional regulator [bacterium]OGZ18434.1 MAG: hypothetical protein A2V72_01215 [Candidatus Nealsonbacteria bacterium RBG_13_37_56]
MGTFHLNNLPKEKRIQMIAEFYDVVNSLKNRQEVRLFLKDLLTGDEIASLMRRIEVAVLLKANFSHQEIRKLLKVSNNKINKVQKVLVSEDRGKGFDLIIERLLAERKERIRRKERDINIKESPEKQLKRKYSHIFLLENLVDDAYDNIKNSSRREKDALLFTPSFGLTDDKNKKE